MAEVSGKAGKGAWYRGGGRGGHERHLHVADVALLGCHTPDTQREKGMARQHTGWAQGLKMECVREDGGGKWRGHKGRHKMGRGKEQRRTVVDDEVLHLVERGLVRHPAVADTHTCHENSEAAGGGPSGD